MQANRIYIYAGKTHPFTCCLAAKHQNAANLALQTSGLAPLGRRLQLSK